MDAGFERLKDAMAEAIAREVEFPVGVLVTVLGAKMTANTAHAKIVLSVFPEQAQPEVLERLRENERYVKETLSERLRLRRIPRLHYTFDTTEARAEDIELTLNRLSDNNEL